MKNNSIKYGIRALRTNGEHVYYVENSNGGFFTPNALSLSRKFDSKGEALKFRAKLDIQWPGLVSMVIFQDI